MFLLCICVCVCLIHSTRKNSAELSVCSYEVYEERKVSSAQLSSVQRKVLGDEAVGVRGPEPGAGLAIAGGKGCGGRRQWGKTWGGNFLSSPLMGRARAGLTVRWLWSEPPPVSDGGAVVPGGADLSKVFSPHTWGL